MMILHPVHGSMQTSKLMHTGKLADSQKLLVHCVLQTLRLTLSMCVLAHMFVGKQALKIIEKWTLCSA
jgi:hypothetical protein